MKIGRNDLCPCGSGLKYKKCCLNKRSNNQEDLRASYLSKHNIRIKDKNDIDAIRRTGMLVIDTLEQAEKLIAPGIKTDDINMVLHEYTLKNNAVPASLNYRGFPKSVCISINDEICHGIPGNRTLKQGDIVNIDVTSILDGYYADASKTYFVGKPGARAQKIVSVARESLKAGIKMIRPGNRIGDIGWAIQRYAEGQGCSVVREFVGHGVGFDFHESPQIAHYGVRDRGIMMIPGMVFTVEPMINLGKKELHILEDNWTAVTNDGSLSAQFEQTFVVTEEGFESLTPYNLD